MSVRAAEQDAPDVPARLEVLDETGADAAMTVAVLYHLPPDEKRAGGVRRAGMDTVTFSDALTAVRSSKAPSQLALPGHGVRPFGRPDRGGRRPAGCPAAPPPRSPRPNTPASAAGPSTPTASGSVGVGTGTAATARP